MKKSFIILALTIIFIGGVYAGNSTVDINGVDFEIPSKYQNGEFTNGNYQLDNIFSIRCIDDDVPKAVGLWAEEHDFEEDLSIGNHPVKHYCQYNKHVGGNHSHAYFASDKSIYEIAWTGKEIDSDIEKLIENAPPSEINEDAFYKVLNKSIDIYKEQKKIKLNQDGEYNYLEAKYQSVSNQQKAPDNTKLNEILLTYGF